MATSHTPGCCHSTAAPDKRCRGARARSGAPGTPGDSQDAGRTGRRDGPRAWISVPFITAHGDPYHEITRLAGENRADAIVVNASLKVGHHLMESLAVRPVRAGKWPFTVVP